jgi:signal peptidase II
MTDENTSPTQAETSEVSSDPKASGDGSKTEESEAGKASKPEASEDRGEPQASEDRGDPESPPERAAEPPPPRPSLVFLAVVSIGSLVADLGTKYWAKQALDDGRAYGGRRIEAIDGLLAFIFAKNRGGAWGLLQDESEAVRRPFFLLISAAAILFIVTLYRRVTPEQTALKWGLPLVLGGAIGNLIDRIRYGYVVDFIDVHVTKTFRWPTFNVADIAICVGVGLMAIDMFTSRKPNKAKAGEGSAPLSPPADRA